MFVNVIVKLRIDAKQEDIAEIIQECDYDFKDENNRIKSMEIIDYSIQ